MTAEPRRFVAQLPLSGFSYKGAEEKQI